MKSTVQKTNFMASNMKRPIFEHANLLKASKELFFIPFRLGHLLRLHAPSSQKEKNKTKAIVGIVKPTPFFHSAMSRTKPQTCTDKLAPIQSTS